MVISTHAHHSVPHLYWVNQEMVDQGLCVLCHNLPSSIPLSLFNHRHRFPTIKPSAWLLHCRIEPCVHICLGGYRHRLTFFKCTILGFDVDAEPTNAEPTAAPCVVSLVWIWWNCKHKECSQVLCTSVGNTWYTRFANALSV